MKSIVKPIVGRAVAIVVAIAAAGAIVTAAGSVAAGTNAFYPPVPKVNKLSAIPKKNPLAIRRAPAPKSRAVSGSGGGKSGAGEEGPRFGLERPAPERQIPDAPVAGTAGPARGIPSE